MTTGIQKYTSATLANDIRTAIEYLTLEDCGCCTFKLNGRLAVCVGWTKGYAVDDESVIHSESEPEFAIAAGIKVWTSDALRTDFDWINSPYYEFGDIEDVERAIEPDENLENLADWLLEEYNRLKDLNIDEDGLIHLYRYYVDACGHDEEEMLTDFEEEYGDFDDLEDAIEAFKEKIENGFVREFLDNPTTASITIRIEKCKEDVDTIECIEVVKEKTIYRCDY